VEEHYFLRIRDLIDQHQPDLMYRRPNLLWRLGPFADGALLQRHRQKHGKVEAVWGQQGQRRLCEGDLPAGCRARRRRSHLG
jgi:hypothetical protein